MKTVREISDEYSSEVLEIQKAFSSLSDTKIIMMALSCILKEIHIRSEPYTRHEINAVWGELEKRTEEPSK